MPEQWQCGHCDLIVELPPEREHPDLYGAAVMFIREHRFGHITDRLINGGDKGLRELCDDAPSGHWTVDPNAHGPLAEYFRGEQRVPVTDDDVAPAVEMAEAIVRGRA